MTVWVVQGGDQGLDRGYANPCQCADRGRFDLSVTISKRGNESLDRAGVALFAQNRGRTASDHHAGSFEVTYVLGHEIGLTIHG